MKKQNTIKKMKDKTIESNLVKEWNRINPIETPVCYRSNGRLSYSTSKAWTEDGYDIIMIEDSEEPVLLYKVARDPTRLPRKIIEKYSRPINKEQG